MIWRLSALGLSLFILFWAVSWLAARMLIVGVPLERADAIVVLSGSGTYVERTRAAASLFKEGQSQKIILTNDNRASGWSSAEQRNPLYVERSLHELLQSGIPREAVEILSDPVSSTRDEALLLQTYVKQRRIESLLVVTSAYHSRRALWIFRHFVGAQGIQVGVNPVATGIQTPQPSSWWLYSLGWKMVPGEYLKLMYYRLRL